MMVYFLRLAYLFDPSLVHHQDAIADIPYDGKVMGNEYHRKPKFFFQVVQQAEHLGLYAYIEGRHGLVTYHKGRSQYQCPGYDDTLSLTSREFMGVAVVMLRGKAHFLQ